MNPEHPVYIISKGRWESRFTSKALERIKVMESSIPKLDKNNYAHGAKIADEALSQKP